MCANAIADELVYSLICLCEQFIDAVICTAFAEFDPNAQCWAVVGSIRVFACIHCITDFVF